MPPVPARRQPVPWAELRRGATTVFLMLQAGWTALSAEEREEVAQLLRKSGGRPRNLSRPEARRLGGLAGRAASAATRARQSR